MIEFGDPRLPSRFWAKVQVAESGCWEWTASRDRYGYGKFSEYVDGRQHIRLTHRLAYQRLVGPVDPELTLDHLCHTHDRNCRGGETCAHRACLNPAHLEPVTREVNLQRQSPALSDTCRRGHLYGDYTESNGRRRCRECHRASKLQRRSAQRSAA